MTDASPLIVSDEAAQSLQQAAAALGTTFDEMRDAFLRMAQSIRDALVQIDPVIRALAEEIKRDEQTRQAIQGLLPSRSDVLRAHRQRFRLDAQTAVPIKLTRLPGRRWRG